MKFHDFSPFYRSNEGIKPKVSGDRLLDNPLVADLQSGASFKFDGANDKVEVGDVTILDGATSMTAECWFKMGTPSAEQVIFAKAYTDYVFEIRCLTTGKAAIRMRSDTGGSASVAPWPLTGNMTISDNQWKNVIITWDGSTVSLYVDGVLDVTGTLNGGGLKNTPDLLGFGGEISSSGLVVNDFEGEIRQGRIHNRALSADEVRAAYNGQAVPYEYVGASQTELVTNGNMESALTTGWNVEAGLTMAQSSTTRSGGGDSYSANIYGDTTPPNGNEFYQNMTGLTVGKRYRVSAWVFNNSGTQFFSRETYSYAAGYGVSDHAHINLPSNNAWTFYEAEFTSANALAQYSFYLSGTVTTGQLLIDDVSITQIGCVAEYLPDGITSSEWTDSSGNDLDGTVTGAVVSGINPIADLASNAMNIAMAVALG